MGAGRSDIAAAQHCLHTLCWCDSWNRAGITSGAVAQQPSTEREKGRNGNEKQRISYHLSSAASSVPTGKQTAQVIRYMQS